MNYPLLVPAAGKGKRLMPYTKDVPKVLLEYNGKPALEYVFDVAEKMCVEEIFVVTGYQGGKVKQYVNEHKRNFDISFIELNELKGLVYAISKAEPYVKGRPFIKIDGDEIHINSRHKEFVDFCRKNNPDCVCGILNVENKDVVKKNFSVELNNDNNIERLVEKPEITPNNLLGVGTTFYQPFVFDYIGRTPVDPRTGEKTTAELIMEMVKDGKKVSVFDLGGSYAHLNHTEDLKNWRVLK